MNILGITVYVLVLALYLIGGVTIILMGKPRLLAIPMIMCLGIMVMLYFI